jgi:hypothetical protein
MGIVGPNARCNTTWSVNSRANESGGTSARAAIITEERSKQLLNVVRLPNLPDNGSESMTPTIVHANPTPLNTPKLLIQANTFSDC